MPTVNHPELFPLASSWWLYLLFCFFILFALFIDLKKREGTEHVIGHREAILNVLFWIALALIFCGCLYAYAFFRFPVDPRLAGCDTRFLAKQCTLEFLSGYLIEKSLSIDNLFIFLVVFDFFAIPEKFRHRILFYGILGALIFRGIFIAIGAALMQIVWVPVVFGIFLFLTGLKVAFGADSHPDPSKNPMIRAIKHLLPIIPELRSGSFFVKKNDKWFGTPLLLALLFIEVTDVIFALDSVPAIFAITREPFIVFTSNVFAILGLRALYFLLAGMVSNFHYLKYGLGFILAFVGVKMSWLDHHFGGRFPTGYSLGIIVIALLFSGVASWLFPPRDKIVKMGAK